MNEANTDAFGFTPEQIKWTLPLIALVYEYYFGLNQRDLRTFPMVVSFGVES